MKLARIFFFLMIAAPLISDAQHKSKKHSDVSAVFEQAHFVYVQAMDGDVMKPSLYPEDRQAISDVQDGIRDWGRYSLAIRREDADLVFMVRVGRALGEQNRGGISVGRPPNPNGPNSPNAPNGPNGPNGPNRQPGQFPEEGTVVGVGTELGPSDDMLRVFTTNPDGKLIGPIWHREMPDGLDGPTVPLLRQLRAAVEQAYPTQPAPKHP